MDSLLFKNNKPYGMKKWLTEENPDAIIVNAVYHGKTVVQTFGYEPYDSQDGISIPVSTEGPICKYFWFLLTNLLI